MQESKEIRFDGKRIVEYGWRGETVCYFPFEDQISTRRYGNLFVNAPRMRLALKAIARRMAILANTYPDCPESDELMELVAIANEAIDRKHNQMPE